MEHDSLDCYDIIPSEMRAYLRHYGRHFSKGMFDFAVSKMKVRGSDGKAERFTPVSKEQFDSYMLGYGIQLDNDVMYDGLYVFNMAKSDFFGSSLPDERSLCLFVKDYVDDIDQADGFIFNRFYADCVRKGIPIPWERCI